MLRRIVLVLSVVALMLVMMAMSVGPAFAAGWNSLTGCRGEDQRFFYPGSGLGYGRVDHNGDNFVCLNEGPQGTHAYDNRTITE